MSPRENTSSSPSSTDTPRGWLASIREAVSGNRHDFTTGSLGRAIVLLAVPMVLEMLMQSVFELADIFFVGRLGADAVAAVGLTASFLILIFAVGMGLSMAASAMVARRMGEKNPEAASVTAVQAIALAVLLSVPIGLAGAAFAPDLLRLMGATDEVVAAGATYCAILLGTNITILLLFLINAIFRGAGDAVLAMRALGLANALNIVLDPLLIFGIGPFPELGVTGAAVATAIGRSVGVGYQLYALTNGRGRLHVHRRSLRINREVMKRMLRISGPGVVQFLVGSASWIVIIRLVAGFGSEAVAGYTIGVRVIIFALLPSWGMGNAAATLVGQNLGARQPDRAERAVWITSLGNSAFLTLVAVALLLLGVPIMGIFATEAGVVAVGSEFLHIIAYSYPFFAVGMVAVQAFNGAGDTVTPTWINIFCYWLFQIPLAYALAHPLGLGVTGIFAAIAIAQVVFASVGAALFRRGWWKAKVV
jgi:putative MATE family efflux protein